MSHFRALAHQLSLLLTAVAVFSLRLLPSPLQLRLSFCKDVTLSFFALAAGKFLPHLTFPSKDLTGRTAIVTGANSGIGLEIASDLARAGAKVYLACRNQARAEQAIRTLLERVPEAKARLAFLQLDTSSLESVRAAARTWSGLDEQQLDILVHNAGIPGPPDLNKAMTEDGLESTYATNVLGSFLLTHLVEPCMTPDARIIFTSSTGQYGGRFADDFHLGPVRDVCEPGFHCFPTKIPRSSSYVVSASERYTQTKAMQCVLAKQLQQRFDRLAVEAGAGPRKRAFAFTPGFTYTPIFGKTGNPSIFQDPLFYVLVALCEVAATNVAQGARTGSWLAMTDQEKALNNAGGYFDRLHPRLSTADMMSVELRERMWIRWERDAGIEWR